MGKQNQRVKWSRFLGNPFLSAVLNSRKEKGERETPFFYWPQKGAARRKVEENSFPWWSLLPFPFPARRKGEWTCLSSLFRWGLFGWVQGSVHGPAWIPNQTTLFRFMPISRWHKTTRLHDSLLAGVDSGKVSVLHRQNFPLILELTKLLDSVHQDLKTNWNWPKLVLNNWPCLWLLPHHAIVWL